MRGSPVRLVLAIWGLTGALAWAPLQAMAAPVKGTVSLPDDLKSGRRFEGYWRVENGIVPIAPAPNRGDTVVVLTGIKGQAPAAKTVTVDINGLQGVPSTVVIGENSVVEFKNSDKVPHDLSIPDQPSLMPLQRLAPGGVRRQRFLVAGGYTVRCAEYPHMLISVVVVGSPHFAQTDDKGGFKFDAPDGKATLKVWSHGRWVDERAIEVGPGSADLDIKVTQESDGKSAAE